MYTLCVYIYIYIHIERHTYIHIYIVWSSVLFDFDTASMISPMTTAFTAVPFRVWSSTVYHSIA